MPDVMLGWFCSLLSVLGEVFGREISYSGVERLITLIWDVLVPQGDQVRALNRLSMCSRSLCFQIRQWCQLASLLSFAPGFVGVGFSQKCIHTQLGT
jgi:hypothetical protein